MNINATLNTVRTPLYLACENSQYDTVLFLLNLNDQTINRRVDTTIKNAARWSVLHAACSKGLTNVVEFLIEFGLNVNDTSNEGAHHLICLIRTVTITG